MAESQILHASCVAVEGVAVLILGRSASGKSGLALQLMSSGAVLVADDRTEVRIGASGIMARSPDTLSGLIEARGVGILRADTVDSARIALVIDLDQTESERLPMPHSASILGHALPCLHKVEAPHFPAAILQYLKCGRKDPS